MAVYERTYHPYTGPLTPLNRRFLVLPRYSFQDIFSSKLVIGFLVICGLPPLAYAVMIYLPHNVSVLKLLQEQAGMNMGEFWPFRYDAGFFFWFLAIQSWLAFFLVFVVGPQVISADLRNNALPLYLARPFSRWDYILGKSTAVLILLSVITWVPGLLLFFLQSYLEGWNWLGSHLNVAAGLFFGSWIYIVLLTLITLSLSAYVKWKPLARLGLFGVIFVSGGVAGMMNFMLKTKWASVLNITDMVRVVWSTLFGVDSNVGIPAWAAWISLLVVCGLCVLLLQRKVRAYEVVR